MSDSLIQSDLSELVIGLSSEHSYREITPTHTHTRAQFLYASTGNIQVFTPKECDDHSEWEKIRFWMFIGIKSNPRL